jgi:hypothetical protein
MILMINVSKLSFSKIDVQPLRNKLFVPVLPLKFVIIFFLKENLGLTMLSCLLIRYQHLGQLRDVGAQEGDRPCQLLGRYQADHYREVEVTINNE